MIPYLVIIDPGITEMGVLVSDGKRIISAETWRTPSVSEPDTANTVQRSDELCDRLAPLLVPAPQLVVEGYEDIPGPYRGAKYRWMVPILIGMLGLMASAYDCEIVWQSPKTVMTEYRDYRLMMERGVEVFPGSKQATNEHERAAVCHLLAYLDGRKK